MDTKKSTLFIALRLTAICFVAVLLLGIINAMTAPKIKMNEAKVENDALKSLLPEGKNFKKNNFSTISEELNKEYYFFEVYDANSNLIGYIVSSQGKGFGGNMKVMVAFDTKFKILNAKLLESSESPKQRQQAETDKYMQKFIGSNTEDKELPRNKSMLSAKDVDSVTNATFTFNGIVSAISKAIEYLEQEKKK